VHDEPRERDPDSAVRLRYALSYNLVASPTAVPTILCDKVLIYRHIALLLTAIMRSNSHGFNTFVMSMLHPMYIVPLFRLIISAGLGSQKQKKSFDQWVLCPGVKFVGRRKVLVLDAHYRERGEAHKSAQRHIFGTQLAILSQSQYPVPVRQGRSAQSLSKRPAINKMYFRQAQGR
jgi:hypothetical protein